MRVAWDEPKRRTNFETHGLDLADAESFEWETAIVTPGHPGQENRPRFKAIGWLANELVALVFSPLGSEAVSVISATRKPQG